MISDPKWVQIVQRFRINLHRSLNFNTSLNTFSISKNKSCITMLARGSTHSAFYLNLSEPQSPQFRRQWVLPLLPDPPWIDSATPLFIRQPPISTSPLAPPLMQWLVSDPSLARPSTSLAVIDLVGRDPRQSSCLPFAQPSSPFSGSYSYLLSRPC